MLITPAEPYMEAFLSLGYLGAKIEKELRSKPAYAGEKVNV
jgi:hypothetical protein